jgi:hypothetical protein
MGLETIDRVGSIVIEKWKLLIFLTLTLTTLYGFSNTLLPEANQKIQDIRSYYETKTSFEGDKIIIEKQDWKFTLSPVEEYTISGEVVGKKTYRSGDPGHLISPTDLAIAWGDLTKPELQGEVNLETLETVSMDYIKTHSSNNHIIPANEEIKKEISNLKVGDKIALTGRLVNVEGKNQEQTNNSIVKTSMKRTDSGPGSCEIIFVEKVTAIM